MAAANDFSGFGPSGLLPSALPANDTWEAKGAIATFTFKSGFGQAVNYLGPPQGGLRAGDSERSRRERRGTAPGNRHQRVRGR